MKPSIPICLFLLSTSVFADIYMHNPAGSNNRNRERNVNRNNNRRLFDSQNNDKGGYPWRGDRNLKNKSDPLVYYEGSMLRIEWTNQHACGDDPTTHCSMVLQYACNDSVPGVRDGYPSGEIVDADATIYQPITYKKVAFQDPNNPDGTNTITEANKDNWEYGMHENYAYYAKCGMRTRNKGLYTADRKLRENIGARATRQNPGGTQYGFECPEEKDYYPYWAASPWRDIAVLVSDESWCEYYKTESQNVKDRFECVGATLPNNQLMPIDEAGCTKLQGTWKKIPAWQIPAPDCKLHPRSRQNHLGNVNVDKNGLPETAHYNWKIPNLNSLGGGPQRECVLRIRYNISTGDYPSYGGFAPNSEVFGSTHNCAEIDTNPTPPPPPDATQGRSSVDDNTGGVPTNTGCSSNLVRHQRPLYNRPYVSAFGSDHPALGIAINTDQSGRTFQDRSHVFAIKKRTIPDDEFNTIWNVNTRGRRGNIVQAYPAVEYDFVPQDLTVLQGHYLHFQWSGSDFNTPINPNNGEGWKYSDRHNLVQVDDLNYQFPVDWDTLANEKMNFFPDKETALRFAFQGAEEALQKEGVKCGTRFKNGAKDEQNHPLNCGKLNWANAHFDNDLMQVKQKAGTYKFVNTRDNNFSNRAQKWSLGVEYNPNFNSGATPGGTAAGIAIGAILIALIVGGVILAVVLKRRNQLSRNGFKAFCKGIFYQNEHTQLINNADSNTSNTYTSTGARNTRV